MTATTSRGTATVDVTIDGSPLAEELTRRLVSVRVSSRLSTPTQCELTFATWRGSAAEHDRAPLGAAVSVRITGDTEALFDGEVTCVELAHDPDGHAVARIRCYDKLHRLRKRARPRVIEDVTAAGLAEELTSDLGLSVDADDEGPRWERIVQHRQTDFELLTEVANRAGLHPVLHGDELRLVTLAGHGDTVDLELGVNLLQARIEANLDRVGRSCKAFGWDTRAAEVIEETATEPRSGRWIQLDPDPGDVGVDGELLLVDQPGRSAEEVAAAAQAALDNAYGRAVTISGVAEGDARLRAGGRIDVQGLADPVSGRYVLTEAVHTVDATGYLTTFDTEPPAQPAGNQFNAITLGLVTDVDDPDNLGRVKVSLPAHGDADVGWLGVVCPGAGRDKGFVALPDVDDTVLVALPHGGPVGGLVLGSLYGSVEPPDPGVEDGAVKRWSLRTADGQAITIDDAEHRITVRDKTGSFVRLAPDLVTVHAATDLTLQAPGKAIKVRARTVDFEHAPEQGEPEEGAS